ncbi:MAG: hypothetical protein D6746_16710 [Bacteroidetes bacterium]|nr:MAG: hypothetical protein D6746_16710 [Bacteroidota bacterium]
MYVSQRDADGTNIIQNIVSKIRRVGYMFYNSARRNSPMDGSPPHALRVESTGNPNMLESMLSQAEALDRMISFAMNIPPQAEAVFDRYSNASDNERALALTGPLMQDIFNTVNKWWQQALTSHLENLRLFFTERLKDMPDMSELAFEYQLPTGSRELLLVTPESLTYETMGIHVSTKRNDLFRDFLLRTGAQAMLQNGVSITDVGSLFKAASDMVSDDEISLMLALLENKTRKERMQQAQQQQQMELERLRQQFDMELKLALAKEQARKETLVAMQEAGLLRFALQNDIDQDKENDFITAKKIEAELKERIAEMEKQLKEKELALKEKEIKLKYSQNGKS